MRFTILAALVASANAWKFTAYGGENCAGDQGSMIDTKPPGQTVCSNIGTRASYRLTKLDGDTSTSITVAIYGQDGCNGDVVSTATNGEGCYNIDVGTYASALISAN